MSELTGIVHAKFKSKDFFDRFNIYFDFESRPRFIEDAPAEQSNLVELAEHIEYPLEVKDNDRGYFYFYWFEESPEETLKVIAQLGLFFKAEKLVAYVQNDEEYKEYFQLVDGEVKSLYVVGDEESSNYNLGFERKLESLDYDERALAFVAKSLV